MIACQQMGLSGDKPPVCLGFRFFGTGVRDVRRASNEQHRFGCPPLRLLTVFCLIVWFAGTTGLFAERLFAPSPPLEVLSRQLIEHLDIFPELNNISDIEFSEYLERSLAFVLENEAASTCLGVTYAAAAIAACHWQKPHIAREFLLMAGRNAQTVGLREWTHVFLFQLARRQLLHGTFLDRRPYTESLPGPDLQVLFERMLQGELVLYTESPELTESAVRSRAGLVLSDLAWSVHEDGQAGTARALIRRAAENNFGTTQDPGQRLGSMIWESRRLRSQQRWFAALVTLLQADILAQDQEVWYWRAILAEDLGDVWTALGRIERARQALQEAFDLFQRLNPASGMRVLEKINLLPEQ